MLIDNKSITSIGAASISIGFSVAEHPDGGAAEDSRYGMGSVQGMVEFTVMGTRFSLGKTR